jgi:hypothetical protein
LKRNESWAELQAAESQAAKTITEQTKDVRDLLPPKLELLWDWALEQPQNVLLKVLTVAVAHTVNAVQSPHDYASNGRLAAADVLARALTFDMADWWRPTAANYFARIKKDQIRRSFWQRVPNAIQNTPFGLTAFFGSPRQKISRTDYDNAVIDPAALPNRGFFDQPKKQKHQQRSPPVLQRYQRTTRPPEAWNQCKRERSSHQNTDFIENNFHGRAIETFEKQRFTSLLLVRTALVSLLHRSTDGWIEPIGPRSSGMSLR